MTYIYDILLNFHNKLYDFYEWNSSDQILHVKKIPLFNLNSNDYLKIKNNIVKFPKKFTDKLHNSAILYKKRKIINYMFLITDETDIIAIKLNKNGISI
ncbi:MAG: DUF3603 family protein, partial [Bacilli bacterium]|nr:DUF3603 family protein [Bacilli bacterium]